MFPKKELAQLVISACHQFNIDTVVISPGSRNAPLTIGFSNHPTIEALSVVDERCAAFFAMGIAQQKQKPVAIVCSSGSALLNYYPAIAEAFYSQIPLVIISADRPKHLIDIGDGQTIRQENVFENHILSSANLIEEESKLKNNTDLLVETLQTSINQKGPVHINVPFDEPLYETVEELKVFDFSSVISREVEKSHKDYEILSSIWNSSTKKMILVGSNFPDVELQKILDVYADDTSVLVLTETTSNVYHPKFINSIDKLISKLTEEEYKKLQPEVLITLGGMVISKRIKQFLRKLQPKHHWHVDELKAMDTYHCLSEFVQTNPVTFLRVLSGKKKDVLSNYQIRWLQEKELKAVKHEEYLKNCEYSDLKSFEVILNSIPNNSQVQISNSSIIRYSQLFDVNSTLKVFCNRGTSGIDGSTSTAIGAAFGSENQTVFITGDLSFFYDSNALWNTNIPKNFRIIILNNAGGGIFRYIPGPLSTNAAEYFETPHGLTAEYLSKMYGFEYVQVKDLKSLQNSLTSFYEESNQPKIMEIFTPKEINDVVLKNYFKNV
ncbi:2-succinyl-5-enolpyruvyl-6-hydroxy-3-cyclohexene-1-carboxylic-acid synthase [Tenacibaculum sp. 1_MG-2023]|uniref:2-succinyl-5-enolpyruvyl-6-hydroxy-3- cyclohexene-1-carboxylic-acid synthase n=1 Tax=Tenacibaculum sp. 1_MG-2023 TaxID=3062653 RepID=UPI0026E3285A|nr:2-succinyl-5-enolpyruvyl-6-hydroxy-3-cyclohexene-1-carboxylic-acid synthase [Tenacibaculum sp. 1_MG-2023]MDO6674519.1 2-succinyl-5-enolpyruvyl-6-hydroxy-3-cyclohexene-1-carboxylic-acid synthase [Tenacibaculum sp. 1_MG-2023]